MHQTASSTQSVDDPMTEAFFQIYTAAALGHPRARMQYSIYYLQNGLMPSKALLKESLSGKYAYLRYVSPDILRFIDDEVMTDVHYMKHIASAESLLQLYLASQSSILDEITDKTLLGLGDDLEVIKPNEAIITKQDIKDFKK